MPPRRQAAKARKPVADSDSSGESSRDSSPVRGERISNRLKAAAAHDVEVEKNIGAWLSDGTLNILSSSSLPKTPKIVAFDMDDTLIKTKSGKTFGVSADDWQFWHPDVPKILKSYVDDGYKLVIFTNQGGVRGKNGYDASKEKMLKSKIEKIVTALGVPVQVFMATADDKYRKPATTMWDFMVEFSKTPVDLDQCIFVGDAAGKKDFSCSDRKFAYNVGIKFATPEEFFLKQKPADFDWDGLSPEDLKALPKGKPNFTLPGTTEMIVFCGFPASGKTTFYRTYLQPKGYEHANRDTLKTQQKCQQAARAALSAGKSIAIDNTCADPSVRAEYIEIAKEFRVPIRCFYFNVSRTLANHLNYLRERVSDGALPHVPGIGYNVYEAFCHFLYRNYTIYWPWTKGYAKNFQMPTTAEGFDEVVKLDFFFQPPDEASGAEFGKLA